MGIKTKTGLAAIAVTVTAFVFILLAFVTPYWLVNDGLVPDSNFQKIVFYEPTDLSIAKRPFTAQNWQAIKFITPNLTELKAIASCFNIETNQKLSNRLEEASNIAYKLAELIENVIVTLGPQGVLIARKGSATNGFFASNSNAQKISVRHYPALSIKDFVNVSGAGDCFASGFITALLKNLPENQCVSVGLAAATTALYSQSPVPNKIFDFAHKSWKMEAQFVELK